MSGEQTKLIAPKRVGVNCAVGLQDDSGVFLLLVDANETRHFRFSSESDLIAQLQDEIADCEVEIASLSRTAASLKRQLTLKEREITKCCNAARKIAKKVPKGAKREAAYEILADNHISIDGKEGR